MPVSANLDKLLVKEYEEKSLDELADAPIAAIAGISKSDEEALLAAFNIKTVRDLGTHKYFRAAAAIVALADSSKTGH